jgi:hypothetical protein
MARDEGEAKGLTRGMKTAVIAVGTVVLIGVAASTLLLWTAQATPSALLTGGAASTSSPSSTTSSSSSPSNPQSAADGDAPRTGAPGPVPGRTPTQGSEVRDLTAAPNRTLPPITPAPPLIAGPLPASGTKAGGLVAGFPTKIMGPAAKTTVVSSSIASDGHTMQVALVGRSTTSPTEIRAHYALLWASLRLVPQQTTDGTTAFRSSYDSLTLSFDPSGTGTHYTVFGVFRTR